MTFVPASNAEGLRGEVQLDQAISPAGAYGSDDTDISSSGFNVYAVWTEAAVPPSTSNDIYYCRSLDGGKSWSSPINLSANDVIDDGKADITSDGNRVVVAWLHGSALATQDVRAVVSTDGGATFGPVLELSGSLKGDAGDADSLRVKIKSSNIYVSFEDDAANPGLTEDVYVVSSMDGGTNFGSPVRVNDSAAGTVDCDDPELDTTGSTAYFVWLDKRTGNDGVYFSSSVDGGANWSADKRLDRGGLIGDAGNPSMSVEGSNVYIDWVDDRNNPAVADEVFFVSSANSGVSFTLDKKLGSAASGVDADSPRISVSGSHVYAVWVDNRNGLNSDVFLAASSDGGSTFSSEFALDPDAGSIHDVSPHLRAKGDSVFVLYQEETFAPLLHQMWLSYSPNRGVSGSFQRLRLSSSLGPAGDANDHQFTVTDYRDVVGVWTDDRADGLTHDVYANGQRFPNLTAVQNGSRISFQISDATPSEEGKFFLAVFSLTGTNSTILPGGMNLCLTVDSFTLLLIQAPIIPFVSDFVQNGAASTSDLPLKMTGYAAGLIINPVGTVILAATDPVRFN